MLKKPERRIDGLAENPSIAWPAQLLNWCLGQPPHVNRMMVSEVCPDGGTHFLAS
jgi:hypothetical protein